MSLRIGDTAPNFDAETTTGPINFHDWIGSQWAFFFSHPADFTPVCTTEMGRTAQLAEQFAARNVKPIGLSTDTVAEHVKWIDDVNDTQNTTLRFPIVADADLKIAKLYDMIHPSESETAAVRSVFIIDPDKKVRLTMTYPMSVGRNFDEILRVCDALQTGDANKIATPADWVPGQDVIIPPSVTDEEAKAAFPQGFETLRPYLRKVKL
ncbi:peroxiredoxin [Sulfitobacter donghicola]|uniref:Alkyl hydroperoxide reductase C n=1 Tax=Sulfitobacter donghicola DSW-25 = KCTC 12864 = JCM 14565 TaxID=1300350 RepID=A0A073ILZ0_9RHOB|nr:peroxiredoxin [Sulfitobacter donghicola]KEJ90769.1 peroxidase [Sulfitobacter donghicola DSW-25 = KCTC 12864 = JCM 14565]KIN68028.1 putative antioxidant protein [Sulfitobacter donghicola DSW-25 = KCTC 12864 = JCM 14565]